VIEQAAVRSREYAHAARIKGEEPSMYEELVLVRGIVDLVQCTMRWTRSRIF